MASEKNLNVSPYYDDFDPNKNYYRVLYKAGYPIQARELTTQQSILQDQVEKLASRLLAEGDNVVPGEFSLISPSPYVRLSTFTNGAEVEDFVGYTITGATSGVVATVIFAVAASTTDDSILFVSYDDSGTDEESTTFLEGEILESSNPNAITGTVGVDGVSLPVDVPPIGEGALFTVGEGSYYINGTIVRNDDQTIVASKYDTRFSAKCGFVVTETFVTSDQDPSLLDNSQGSSNFAAPGADRLKITLTLATRDIDDETDNNFVVLAEVVQGNILRTPGNTVKWDWLYEILARRTYDESGDYIVTDFATNLLEYHNDDDEDQVGLFDADDDGLYPAVPGSEDQTPLTYDEADSKYVVAVDPGKAYVKGYEIDLTNLSYMYGTKARSTKFRPNTLAAITEGFNLTLSNVYGTPDFQNISGVGSSVAFNDVVLYRDFGDGFVGDSASNGRPLNRGNAPWRTYHILADGNIGSAPTGYTEVYKEGRGCVVNTSSTIRRGDSIGNARVLVAHEITPKPAGVIRPRYMLPEDRVNLGDGFFGYNSTFKLGVMQGVYFTEIALSNVKNGGTEWVAGELVEGETSGATGVVEVGSTSTTLILSNVVGSFKPGEKVTQGNKVSEILLNDDVSSLVFINRGTNNNTYDLSNETSLKFKALGATKTLTFSAGDFTKTSYGIFLTNSGRRKLRDFPVAADTTKGGIIYTTVETSPSGVDGYCLFRRGIVNNTLGLAKSFYSPLADTNDFSADISAETNEDSNVIDVANGALFRGQANSTTLVCNNYTGDASKQLLPGDIISFVDDLGSDITSVVLCATKPVGYGANKTKSRIILTVPLPANVSNATVQRVRSKTRGNQRQTLVYQLPAETISTLETNSEETSISYQILREFIVNVQAGASSITLTTTANNETFIDSTSRTSVAVAQNLSDTTDAGQFEGRALTVNSVDVSQDNGKKVILNLGQTLTDSLKIKILIPVFVSDAIAKRKKAIVDHEIELGPDNGTNGDVISLGLADVYEVTAITKDGRNYIDNYTFDNGQRDNIYDISRLVLKPGRRRVGGTVTVTCSYFEHTGTGDFFSVNSYTDEGGVNYENIPTYTSKNILRRETTYSKDKNRNTIYLRDCVDFRPVVNTIGSDATVLARVVDGADEQNAMSFKDSTNGGNAFAPRMPLINTQFICDLQYYQARYDSLFLQSDGALALISGEAADDPQPAKDMSSGIRLYDYFLPPYTFSLSDIYTKKFNYKRYRMQDIAAIDRQVQNLTELVTLSLLEQDAINMNVRDAATGLDRFKNGIVVDNFSNHANGETKLTQYRCAIDPENDILRAPYFIDQLELEDVVQTNKGRSDKNYALNNGIITLDYTPARLINQPKATRWINVQPYSVFTYEGELRLFPDIDTFSDQNRLPDLRIEDNSLFNAMVDQTQTMNGGGMGTVWGRWSESGQTRSRTQTQTTINVTSSRMERTSYGDRVVDVQVAEKMRTIPVRFTASNLKPNTTYYAFFDGVNVTDWCIRGRLSTNFSDGVRRYTGADNTSSKFSDALVSDGVGRIQGYFLVPSGRAPKGDSGLNVTKRFWGVQYRTSGTSRSFSTGTRTLRLTDNVQNPSDLELVGGICETNFTSSGVISDVQETIVSTRIPEFSTSTRITDTETQQIPQPVINNITNVTNEITNVTNVTEVTEVTNVTNVTEVTEVTNNIVRQQEPNRWDPVAQTFSVSSKTAPEGVFLTSVDVFFRTIDKKAPCEVYLVTTDGQVPTEIILPHSHVTKTAKTTIKVRCTKLVGSTTTLRSGTRVKGAKSGCVGTLSSAVVFSSAGTNASTNVNNSTYNLVIGSYEGAQGFEPGEQIIPLVSPRLADKFYIAGDTYRLTRADIVKLGSGYTNATVTFSAPQLPGGTRATGICKVADGRVYEVEVTNPGSGYTSIPTATVSGNGKGATITCRADFRDGRAVRMGCTASNDATVATRFEFKAPVFIAPDTYYAFVVKSATSLDYTVWTAKMGEFEIGANGKVTNKRVTKQPTLGALFKSQNGGLWTEDQTQDMAFRIYCANFKTNTVAQVELQNEPLDVRVLLTDPIETNNDGSDTTSFAFGDNPKIVKVHHHMHGLAPGDYVAIGGVVNNPGGIPNEELNTLHTVIASDMEAFTFEVTTSATSSGRDGGSSVSCSYNRPFEVINVTSGVMDFTTTNVVAGVKSIAHAGTTGSNSGGQYNQDGGFNIKLTENFYYSNSRQIANYLNEAKYLARTNGRSLRTYINLSTANNLVSPVIDYTRTKGTIVRNMIDNPNSVDSIFSPNNFTITFDGDITASALTVGDPLEFTEGGTNYSANITKINYNTGKITYSGQYASMINESTTFTNATLAALDVEDITETEGGGYYPETSNSGSAWAKWISRLFEFENECDGIEVRMAAVFYDTNDIKLYYKPRNTGFDGDFGDVEWVPFNGNGLPDGVGNIKARSSNNVDPNSMSPKAWTSLTWTVQDIEKFDGLSVKIVMTANNPAKAPLIDDIQIVCSE